MFFGLIIRMYYAPKEHNPPHIQAWIEIHKDELLANWNLCQNGEAPSTLRSQFPIPPNTGL